MTVSRFENWAGGFLARQVALVLARPGRTLVVLFLLMLLSAYAAMSRLGIDTDSSRMIDDREPFRVNALRFEKLFPDQRNRILLVVRARTPDDADAAAMELSARLAAQPSLFRDVFTPASDPFFRQQGLLFLDQDELIDLSDRLSSAAPILKALIADPSLARMFHQLGKVERASEEGIGLPVVAAAYDEVAAVVEGLVAGEPRALSWQQLFGEREDVIQRVVSAVPVLDFSSLQPARPAIVAARAAIDGITVDGVEIGLTGDPVLRTEELRSVSEGIGLSALLSLLFVALLLAVGLRDWQYLAVAIIALMSSLILTAGFAAIAVGKLNLVSIAFTVLLIGLGIDFAIHLLLACRDGRVRGADKRQAMLDAVREVGPALLLAAVTTSAAFFAFVPTRFAGMAQLGIIAGTGVLIAFLVTLTLIPAALAFLPGTSRAPASGLRLAGFATPKRGRVVFPVLLMLSGLLAVPIAVNMRFDADPMALRDHDAPSVQAFGLLFDRPQDTPYRLSLMSPTLVEALALAERLEALPEIRSVISLSDFVPDNQEDKLFEIDFLAGNLDFLLAKDRGISDAERAAIIAGRGDDREELSGLIAAAANIAAIDAGTARGRAAARLEAALVDFARLAGNDPAQFRRLEDLMLRHFPARMALLSDQLGAAPVTIAGLPPELKRRFVADDGTVRIEVLPQADVRERGARAAFVAAAASVATGLSGGAYSVSEAGRVVALSMVEASLLALFAAAVLIQIMLRRWRLLLLILIPLGLAGLWTIATGVMLDIPFNFANVIVLPLMIGIGVDSAIHLVMRADSLDAQGSLFQSSTPRAVLLSALTTIATFGTLGLSSHRGTASMGIMLMIAILATLLAMLVVLPALLRLFGIDASDRDERI